MKGAAESNIKEAFFRVQGRAALRRNDMRDSKRQPYQHALDLLMDEHREFLNFLHSLTGDREASADIMQQAALKILEHRLHPQSLAKTRAWIYALLRNAVTDRYRRRATESRAIEIMAQEPGPTAYETGEPCRCVAQELATMKPDYVDALRELEMKSKSIREYAGQRNLSETNVSVRLHRARKALRERVERSCGACAGAGCFACSCEVTAQPVSITATSV